MNNVIELRDITVEFDGERVLDRLNLSIGDGEFVTLLGSSGCGKTTTLRVIAGFIQPQSGEVFLTEKASRASPRTSAPSTRSSRGTRFSRTTTYTKTLRSD